MDKYYKIFFFLFVIITKTFPALSTQHVEVGASLLFKLENISLIRGKKIGVLTNHTAVNCHMEGTLDQLFLNTKKYNYEIKAIFAPEHGLQGSAYAGKNLDHTRNVDNIPIYFLHGKTSRPTKEMLKDIDLVIFDIQDLGSRSYTYCTTLFYLMEEAAKNNIEVLVLDRPNPINGLTIDGPMLEEKFRSMVGYVNVPYCHGMTIGELAQYFNVEYKVGCKLKIIPMKGWRRGMTFQDTGLKWIPTSPQIPEASTAFYYPTTGMIGEISLVNIGVGYTLPFKVVGAPWIDAKIFAKHLNAQKFPGVYFEPFHYRPFYGKYAHEDCNGVLIIITNHKVYKPVTTQYLIIGILKSLYPVKFKEALLLSPLKKEMFNKVSGTEDVYNIMLKQDYIVWPLRSFHAKEREIFSEKRKKYLISNYPI